MKSLKIIGKKYVIRLHEQMSEILKGDVGSCDYRKQVIDIASDVHPDEMADTILHEVLHAVDYAMDTQLTENQVRRIATGLVAVFKDNPKFYSEHIL